ncbi:hypothetical protein MHU86_24809 [Fragilaria crotonensis]|nr:hypothetical protein MHU86_24809 [Fragilaria crotonensis]
MGEERTIPGNALSVHPDLPFRGLERFGVSFLSRFEGSQLPSSVLRSITLIDTPGILSGEKQRTNRGYDFTKVVAWFAERADLIILLFDAHKLDISDELKGAIDVLKGHEDKIRCILNKADQIDRQQLMRGKLCIMTREPCSWFGQSLTSFSLSLRRPLVVARQDNDISRVARVYVGSFWQQPLQNMDNAALFEDEERDLMKDLAILPRQSAVRKINELVKRIRKVKTLAYIIGHLKAQMPSLMEIQFGSGDFPDIKMFSEKLKEVKFSEFSTLSAKQIEELDGVLNNEIPQLMELLPSEKDSPATLKAKLAASSISGSNANVPLPTRNDKFGKKADNASNPFGFDEADTDNYWRLLDTATAREVLVKTGLGKDQLRQIWNLSDIDRDGYFDHEEYVVAMFLVDAVIQKETRSK